MDLMSSVQKNVASNAASKSVYILPLEGLTHSDIGRAGAKAANLGELAGVGFPVPEGFVVTTDAFDRFLADNAVDPTSPSETVGTASLPLEIEQAIRDALIHMGEVPLAVRSSGVAEDLAGTSYAGQYETFLNLRGPDAILSAVRKCWASAFNVRVAAYRAAQGVIKVAPMAVLVQHLIPADTAGVAFTANPVTGDRNETIVSAVKGLGERLVSGQASPDEWLIRGEEAICQHAPEVAIDGDQARAVAEMARRVEAHFGSPQDVEWAIAEGQLYVLQARPMTALPETVEWKAPLRGVWLRNFRLGEWLGDPVTPLFESWLLTRIEERLNRCAEDYCGIPINTPVNGQLHVIVNGWYFQGWNLPERASQLIWALLRHVLPKLLVQPRRVARMMPFTAHFSVELSVREWREDLSPRYRRLVEDGKGAVDHLSPEELVRLIDEVADLAGEYFFSIMSVSGFSTKAEFPLARFYKQHLYPRIGGTYQRLLCGLYTPSLESKAHAVQSLDWFHPTLGERGILPDDSDEAAARRARLEADRRAAEEEARTALAGDSKLLNQFNRLLSTAQRFAPMREEQCCEFTLGWPLMRRAVLRLGTKLCQLGSLDNAEDVFFMTREELLAALNANEAQAGLVGTLVQRRFTWQRQRRLVAPLILGELPAMMKKVLADYEEAIRTQGDISQAGLRGIPASPGRATGVARIIRDLEEFNRLQPGEVLVAPVTTPAWTPLFARAAAVVTDTGGIGSHSSIVAREYGIPAVIGTGDATARLRDGQLVTVDGNAGLVQA